MTNRYSALHPFIHNANTRAWFTFGGAIYSMAPMVSVQRIMIDGYTARVLLKSYATIGDTEPNEYSYPLMHLKDGMDVAVTCGMSGEPIEYNDDDMIAYFDHVKIRRTWIGEMTVTQPEKRGLIPVYVEVWTDLWQLKFS